jgi:hypothetical protein
MKHNKIAELFKNWLFQYLHLGGLRPRSSKSELGGGGMGTSHWRKAPKCRFSATGRNIGERGSE